MRDFVCLLRSGIVLLNLYTSATRSTSYTKRLFSLWNIIMMGERVYIGMSASNWKQGLYNHIHSFSNPRLRNQTARSKYFWSRKDQVLTPQIKW